MWWELAWAALVLVAVLQVVGALVGMALGLRGLWLFAMAPLIAIPVIGVAAIAAPLVGLSWSLLPVIALAAILGAALWPLRRRFGCRMARRRPDPWVFAALAVAGVIIGTQVIVSIGQPGSFSQTFDNVFHLNIVRFILDTGDASSLWVGRLTDHTGGSSFYPAAWHDLVSIVVQISGVGIPVAINAASLVIAAVVWPAGVILLTRQLFGANRVVLLTAGVLAASFPVFPLMLIDYGVLYPYQLGVALVPAVLAVTLRVVGLGAERPWMRAWQGWVLLLGTIPGVVLSHPGAFVAWMAFTVPIAIALLVRGMRRASGWGRRLFYGATFVVYLLVGLAALRVLRPSTGREWPTESSVPAALLEVFTGSVWYGVPAVLGVTLVLVGIVWAFVRRTPAGLVAVGMLAVAAILYVVVTSLPLPGLRDLLTGSWYNNRPRLAALLPIVAVPLGAYGVGATWAWLRSRASFGRGWRSLPRGVRAVSGAGALVAACVLTQLPQISPVPAAIARAAAEYQVTPDARLVDDDELALLERLPDEVPEDAVIVGSPWTGTALAYALAERRVVLPHMFTMTTPEEGLILSSLNEAVDGSPTCDAIEQVGVAYVLDFGDREVHGARNVFEGLVDLDSSPAVELVDQEGHAKLYRVVAC